MIGFYDYTVILTYMSLLSAVSGIMASLNGSGHPYWGMFCLLICGLCDAFDGIVARTKKNRTQIEKNYGIQLDSLSDVVAFGVLPACIGSALLRRSEVFHGDSPMMKVLLIVLHALLALYVLAALIRLAYFNVTEEIRQEQEGDTVRKEFLGLPVTSAALVFPAVLLLDFLIKPVDLGLLYFVVAFALGICFLLKFKVKKVGLRGVLIMVAIGAAEGILLILGILLSNRII